VIKAFATAVIVAGMIWLATHGGHEDASAATSKVEVTPIPRLS
jgi:hypothetical protein